MVVWFVCVCVMMVAIHTYDSLKIDTSPIRSEFCIVFIAFVLLSKCLDSNEENQIYFHAGELAIYGAIS